MRSSLLLALLPAVALADVGPRPSRCDVPATCATCAMHLGAVDAGSDCAAAAEGKGLIKVECQDRSGAVLATYYCPPGTEVGRKTCSVGGGGALALFAAVVLRRLRPRRHSLAAP
ncbi:MAG: hypothetical protein K1X89_11180 [Myxococcaceae bacterium]|nr:hypothetical protein [Myxococcaceae bacterium]